MSKFEKVVTPLIDPELTLEDFSETTGFVGVYFEDIDRPYLDNHIFFLYEWNNKFTDLGKVFYKLRSLKYFYNYKIKYIRGKAYVVYAFVCNPLVKRMIRGALSLRDVNKVRILQFWNFKDSWITINVMRGTIICDSPLKALPLEDYGSCIST